MTNARTNAPTPAGRRLLPWLLLALGIALALGLAGCLDIADEGTFGGDQPAFTGPTPTFSEVQTILTDAQCYDCHNPGAPAAATACGGAGCHASAGTSPYTPNDVATLDYTGMVNVASTAMSGSTIVTPGSSSASTLWSVVNQSGYSGAMGGLMGVGSISNDDKAKIKAWIDGGALE